MKSNNNLPQQNSNDASSGNSKHANQINIGSVGFEGDGDNGAAALRDLKKKHGGATSAKHSSSASKRPML